MIDGVEHVSNLVVRYTILETLYLETLKVTKPALCNQLEGSVVKLYATILSYLSNARRYYVKNTASECSSCCKYWKLMLNRGLILSVERMAGAIVNTAESSVKSFLKKIETAQVDAEACLRIIDAERRLENN
jgi:hypothetical protein